MCEQIGGGEAETTLNACARDSEVSASRRSICLRFSSSSKMKPRGVHPTRVMARGVCAASVRHARARLRSQQRAAHANRSVYERGHRGLDEVVRLRLAKNLLRRPTGGDSPAKRSRKVSISLDLSPLFDARSMRRRASIAAVARHHAFGCVLTCWLGYSRADSQEPHCTGLTEGEHFARPFTSLFRFAIDDATRIDRSR